MNVSSLSDGEITQEAADEINALNVTYFSSISANQRLISLLIHPFGEQFTGYYFCRSQQSNISRKVFTTLTIPSLGINFSKECHITDGRRGEYRYSIWRQYILVYDE